MSQGALSPCCATLLLHTQVTLPTGACARKMQTRTGELRNTPIPGPRQDLTNRCSDSRWPQVGPGRGVSLWPSRGEWLGKGSPSLRSRWLHIAAADRDSSPGVGVGEKWLGREVIWKRRLGLQGSGFKSSSSIPFLLLPMAGAL